jgi:hypothetical protein
MSYLKRHHVILLISANVPRGRRILSFNHRDSFPNISPSRLVAIVSANLLACLQKLRLAALQTGDIWEAGRVREPQHLSSLSLKLEGSNLKASGSVFYS